MKKFIAKYEAIVDLHERGYSEDFQLTGNDLFWLQGKEKIKAEEFYITEYHLFFDTNPFRKQLAIFGVVAFCLELKGILIYHCKHYPNRITPFLRKKLDEALVDSQEEKLFTPLASN